MANVDIKLGYKDSAWFTANAATILKIGQIVYLEQTGTYKIGNGVTALSALSFLGGTSGVASVTGTQVDNTYPLNPVVKPLGLIKIVDLAGDFFTDLTTANAYILTVYSGSPSDIINRSYDNGVYYFTAQDSSVFGSLLTIDAFTQNSAYIIDEFGLIGIIGANSFQNNTGNNILNGVVSFADGCFESSSGINTIGSILLLNTSYYFSKYSSGKFIIKNNIGALETSQYTNFFLNSTASISANASKYTSNAGGIQGDLQTAITNGCNVFFDGIDKEDKKNKSISVLTDQASDIKYSSVKSIFDWATGLFATIANLALKSNIASPTFTGTVTIPDIILSSETASRVAIINASKNVKSADTTTYPSLTELSYGKGVTSSIQTQLNNKGNSQPIYSTKWRTIQYSSSPNVSGGYHSFVWYVPYIVSSTHVVTDIGIEVTTLFAASNVRLALYSDNNGVPGTLIEESGAISSASIGLKTYTFASPIVLSASQQVYWMALQASSASIGLRQSSAALSSIYVIGSGVSGVMYIQAQAFGTFPVSAATASILTSQGSLLISLKAQ